jgi:hypothetical protein
MKFKTHLKSQVMVKHKLFFLFILLWQKFVYYVPVRYTGKVQNGIFKNILSMANRIPLQCRSGTWKFNKFNKHSL